MKPKTSLLSTVALLCIAAASPVVAFTYESPAVAIGRAEAAAEPAPGASASAWSDAGWRALFAENDYDTAGRYFEEALKADPSFPAALEGYGRACEIRGDYDVALSAYLAFIAAAPEHPAAPVYLHRCHVLEEDTNGRAEFLASLTALTENPEAPALLRAKATLFLFDRAHRSGDFAGAEETLAALNFIREWQIIGPFDNEGKEGFNRLFPPETSYAASATYDGKARPVSWRGLPERLPTGFLDLTGVLAPADKAVAYLAVAVNSPTARDAYLAMGAAGAVKVWVNGTPVFSRDAYHEGYFDQYLAPAPLEAGANFILVKICGDDKRWGFGARFVDGDFEPMTDLSFDAGTAALAPASRVVGRAPSEEFDGLSFFDSRLLGDAPDAFDFYYAALEHYARDDADEAEEVPTKLMLGAQSVMPDVADFYYYVGAMEREESRVRANLTRALELAPKHNQARLELAKYYYDLDRPRAAADIIDRLVEEVPAFAEAGQYRAKIDWEMGYAYDARSEAAALSERFPNYPYSKMVEALYEKNYGSIERSVELWQSIYDYDVYASNARNEVFTLSLNRGDLAGAEAAMRRTLAADPYDLDARKKLARALDRHGRHEEALAEIDIALRFRPEDHVLWEIKGTALEKLGRDGESRRAYRQAITFKRNYPALENYLSYLEPSNDGDRAPRLDAYDLLAAFPGEDAFPRDSAVWLLDDRQVEVFDNGTSTRTVHQVIKILTPEGAEKFRYIYVSYSPGSENVEIKRAAVLKPDGTEITATNIKEYNVFDIWSRLYYSYVNKVITMPNLSPGDTVDVEYKISQTGENLFADYFGDFFYFGDKNSTILSRYVLTVPAKKRYYFARLRGAPAPEITRRDEKITYVYRMRDLPSIEEEAYMPALAEILPGVQVSTFATWNDVGRWYNGLIKDVFRASPEIEVLAEELAAGAPDDITKLRRVFDFTVTRVRYVGLEFGIGGYRPHTPKQCLETHYGDCKDKATLMNTLYRLMGFKAYPVLIRTGDLGELDYELPILGLFNHMISYVELPDGRTYFLDGTAEYHSYKELPPNDQGIDVLVVFDDRAEFIRTPVLSPEDNHLTTRTTFVLQPGGDAHVHRTVEYGAADAPAQRERFQVEAKRRTIIEEYWNGLYPGTKIYNEKFSDISDLGAPVRTEYDANVPRMYNPNDARIHLDAVVHKSNLLSRYGKKAERNWPLILRRNEKTTSELTYVLPGDYAVAALPLIKEIRTPFGKLAMDVRSKEGSVYVKQELELYAQRIDPDDYKAFREFCLNVDDWESEPVILQKTR
ncbi:MAG: DUF3857 domain-containing protein [Candidatus Zixiibacteriota bacterium]|jgi:tetratricopeptide (TPR) repeat protein